jgi:hypothetical protein
MSTVSDYTDVLADSPVKTYDYLSAECKESIDRSEWAGQMLLASSMFESFYGFGFDQMSFTDAEVVSFEGSAGSVAMTATGPDGQTLDDDGEAAAWLYEDGRWVIDDCEIMGEADINATTEVSSETALAWPESFCRLDEGMTREEVRAIMGQPTSEFLDESSQDQYQAYQFNITIFYDTPRAQDPDPMKVRANSLEPEVTGEFTELTLDDIALFPCASTAFDERTIEAARANSGR